MTIFSRIFQLYRRFCFYTDRYLSDIATFLLRLVLARVFLSSGLLKWNGWFDFNKQQYDLFLYQFFCPEPARAGALQLCDPETLEYQEGSLTVQLIQWFAISAGIFEILLPILLIIGLFTRIAALGILFMTLLIQLVIFPSWEHWWNPAAWWAITALVIVARGPGRFSLDCISGLDRGKQRQ